MFIDTHTHVYTEEFDADRAAVIARAREAGALHLLLPNIDAASVRPMLSLCEAEPDLCRPMLGLHPTELPADPGPVLDEMEAMLRRPGHPFVAVGEVGVDLYWDDSRRAEQLEVFRRQDRRAAELAPPLVVHTRSAHREVVEVLRPLAARLTGVFHCFGGTAEEADELLSLFPGFVLGIGGVLTFKKSTLPATLRAAVPLDRIVVETDAPYLAPTPHRGRRNEPSFVPLILQKLAETYDVPQPQREQRLLRTTRRIFPRL